MAGTPVPARFPDTGLGSRHRTLVFRWEVTGADFVARGDGAARLAPPDSVRLDFFLAGGIGSGAAVLVGDELRLPPGGDDAPFVPPPALLWAALGRLALPALPDTDARLRGTTLVADLGRPVQWRVTFEQGQLRRLERVDGDRVRAWVARTPDGRIRYHTESDRRTLDLVILRSDDTGPFDATMWTFP